MDRFVLPDDPKSIGVDLAALRLVAGLTQRQLAARMGLKSHGSIARAEAGTHLPRLDFIRRWAEACGFVLELTLLKTPAGLLRDEREAIAQGVRQAVVEREALVERVFGKNNWNPYDRNLTDVERRSLAAEGLTPEQFQAPPTRSKARKTPR